MGDWWKTRSNSRRWAILIAITALVGALGRLAEGFNEDELQHLHAAWLVNQGLVPYRDYFDHHPPLFHYTFAPIVSWLGSSQWALFFGTRALALGVLAAILALFWKLVPRRAGSAVAAGATVLLVISRPSDFLFFLRPDPIAIALLLFAVWRLSAESESRKLDYLLAGLAVGLSAIFTQKTLALAPAFLLWTIVRAIHARGHEKRPSVMSASILALGLAAPVAAFLWLLARAGALQGFFAGPIGFASHWHQTAGWDLYTQEPILIGFGAAVIGFAWAVASVVRLVRRGEETWRADGLLGLLTILGLAGYLRTPAPTQQAYLLTVHVWLLACAARGAAALLTKPEGINLRGRGAKAAISAGIIVSCLLLRPINIPAALAGWGIVLALWLWLPPSLPRIPKFTGPLRLYTALGAIGTLIYFATALDRIKMHPGPAQLASLEELQHLPRPGARVLTTWPVLTPCMPHASYHWFSDISMYSSMPRGVLLGEYLRAIDSPSTGMVVCNPSIVGMMLPEVMRKLDQGFVEHPLSPKGLGGAKAYVRRGAALAMVRPTDQGSRPMRAVR